MIHVGRFIGITISVATVVGLVLGAMSMTIATLPVSMSLFAALNSGLVIACIDANRRITGGRTAMGRSTLGRSASGRGAHGHSAMGRGAQVRRLFTGFDVAAVAVINGAALLGTLSTWALNPEFFLTTALLVLSTGFVGYYLGGLANEAGRRRQQYDSDSVPIVYQTDR